MHVLINRPTVLVPFRANFAHGWLLGVKHVDFRPGDSLRLRVSDGSSISGGSQGSIDFESVSIDIARVNTAFGALAGGMNPTRSLQVR